MLTDNNGVFEKFNGIEIEYMRKVVRKLINKCGTEFKKESQ